MQVGNVLLLILSLVIVLGAGQRALDRLRLTDRQALLFIALILIGGLIPDIPIGAVRINIGGALIPFGLCVYLFICAGSLKERVRSIAAALVTAAAIYAIGHFVPHEPDTMPFDVNYVYGLAAGIVAYLFGRSRRAAFIAGVVGMLLADIVQALILRSNGIEQTLHLGGAGIADTVIIAGITAVLLAELVGEFLERCHRGATSDPHRAFVGGEFVRSERRR